MRAMIFIWRYTRPAKNPTAKASIMGSSGNMRSRLISGKCLKLDNTREHKCHKNKDQNDNED